MPETSPPATAVSVPADPAEDGRFGPSRRAQAQRLGLAWTLAAFTALGLAYGWRPWVHGVWADAAAAGVGAVTGLGLARRLRAQLEARFVELHPQALELHRGDFRRLAVLESLRHLSVTQTPRGRLLRLRLDFPDGRVTLRDTEGLERIFAWVAQRRPADVLIEVEERRVDWGEPLPWIVLALAAVLAAAAWVAL